MKSARKIQIESIFPDQRFDENEIRRLVHWILDDEGENKNWSITIVFVDDDYIINLNRQYFSKDTSTDVISFVLEDSDESGEGEIYVCIDQVKRQATDFNVTFENELYRLVAHGVYHLLGYDDSTLEEKQIMDERQEKALAANHL